MADEKLQEKYFLAYGKINFFGPATVALEFVTVNITKLVVPMFPQYCLKLTSYHFEETPKITIFIRQELLQFLLISSTCFTHNDSLYIIRNIWSWMLLAIWTRLTSCMLQNLCE